MTDRFWLRQGDDLVEEAVAYDTMTEAKDAFETTATELARYGQSHYASIHLASSFEELVDYPDYHLALGEDDEVIVTPC